MTNQEWLEDTAKKYGREAADKCAAIIAESNREKAVREMLLDLRDGASKEDFVLTPQSVADFITRSAGRLYDKGYRKFEIVEEDV